MPLCLASPSSFWVFQACNWLAYYSCCPQTSSFSYHSTPPAASITLTKWLLILFVSLPVKKQLPLYLLKFRSCDWSGPHWFHCFPKPFLSHLLGIWLLDFIFSLGLVRSWDELSWLSFKLFKKWFKREWYVCCSLTIDIAPLKF